MKDIILVGGGGHCKSIIDTIVSKNEFSIIGIIDLKEKIGEEISGFPIIGCDDDLPKFFESGIKFVFISKGSIGDYFVREELYKMVKKIGFKVVNIIDESSIISNDVELGEGIFVGKRAVINSGSKIGNCTIINSGSIIEHECELKEFVHISPGSVLSGNVAVGKGTHIGTNSTIIQGIKIGNNSIIGAGSVVVKDIGNNVKAYGNPCRVREEIEKKWGYK